MDWKREWKPLLWIVSIFIACYYLPIGNSRFDNAVMESLHLVKWYAQEHVLLCLIPAFFIAGAIAVFVSQASVLKYLGAKANKILAYGVASVSGSVLAVCSCTILPLFSGIYKMGAGLGPATAFLYSGPAINVQAIILLPAYSGQNSELQEPSVPSFSVSSSGCSCISFSEKRRWIRPLPKPPCLNLRLRDRFGKMLFILEPWSASWFLRTGENRANRPVSGTRFTTTNG